MAVNRIEGLGPVRNPLASREVFLRNQQRAATNIQRRLGEYGSTPEQMAQLAAAAKADEERRALEYIAALQRAGQWPTSTGGASAGSLGPAAGGGGAGGASSSPPPPPAFDNSTYALMRQAIADRYAQSRSQLDADAARALQNTQAALGDVRGQWQQANQTIAGLQVDPDVYAKLLADAQANNTPGLEAFINAQRAAAQQTSALQQTMGQRLAQIGEQSMRDRVATVSQQQQLALAQLEQARANRNTEIDLSEADARAAYTAAVSGGGGRSGGGGGRGGGRGSADDGRYVDTPWGRMTADQAFDNMMAMQKRQDDYERLGFDMETARQQAERDQAEQVWKQRQAQTERLDRRYEMDTRSAQANYELDRRAALDLYTSGRISRKEYDQMLADARSQYANTLAQAQSTYSTSVNRVYNPPLASGRANANASRTSKGTQAKNNWFGRVANTMKRK